MHKCKGMLCTRQVSEGLNFTDANARAVVVVGIPFPNTKDTQVDLKKRYNDEQRRKGSRQLLSSTEWYTQQAFRYICASHTSSGPPPASLRVASAVHTANHASWQLASVAASTS